MVANFMVEWIRAGKKYGHVQNVSAFSCANFSPINRHGQPAVKPATPSSGDISATCAYAGRTTSCVRCARVNRFWANACRSAIVTPSMRSS